MIKYIVLFKLISLQFLPTTNVLPANLFQLKSCSFSRKDFVQINQSAMFGVDLSMHSKVRVYKMSQMVELESDTRMLVIKRKRMYILICVRNLGNIET